MTEGPDVPFEEVERRCPLCTGRLVFLRWTGTAMEFKCERCQKVLGVLM